MVKKGWVGLYAWYGIPNGPEQNDSGLPGEQREDSASKSGDGRLNENTTALPSV